MEINRTDIVTLLDNSEWIVSDIAEFDDIFVGVQDVPQCNRMRAFATCSIKNVRKSDYTLSDVERLTPKGN